MRSSSNHWSHERQQAVALDLLTERDTLAGLAHVNHLSIHQILAWREDLLSSLRLSRRTSAA